MTRLINPTGRVPGRPPKSSPESPGRRGTLAPTYPLLALVIEAVNLLGSSPTRLLILYLIFGPKRPKIRYLRKLIDGRGRITNPWSMTTQPLLENLFHIELTISGASFGCQQWALVARPAQEA